MEPESAPTDSVVGSFVLEALIGVATLSRWSLFSERRFGDTRHRARSLLFAPVIGLVAGIFLAIIDRALAPMLAPIARSIAVLLIMEAAAGGIDLVGVGDLVDAIRIGSRPASTGIARIGPVGALAAIRWLAAAVYFLARIPNPSGRAAALVMATMLSRWAIVPIGYGLKPMERWGLGVQYEGGITFREFSISSAIALGLAMGFYENIGLGVIVALALTILALRLLLSRRLGGAAGYALAGSMAICELVVFGVLAALRI